jgi:hypothetical protein
VITILSSVIFSVRRDLLCESFSSLGEIFAEFFWNLCQFVNNLIHLIDQFFFRFATKSDAAASDGSLEALPAANALELFERWGLMTVKAQLALRHHLNHSLRAFVLLSKNDRCHAQVVFPKTLIVSKQSSYHKVFPHLKKGFF